MLDRPHQAPATRLRLRLRGAVQGVGFRPFAYGLAVRLSLGGFVLHHLLFHAAGGKRDAAQSFALVATSANPGGEPLITDMPRRTKSSPCACRLAPEKPLVLRSQLDRGLVGRQCL